MRTISSRVLRRTCGRRRRAPELSVRKPMASTAIRSPQITGIIPQFLVDDLDRAIAYYREKLGFDLDFQYESFYASVSRNGFAIHLKEAEKLAGERAHRKRNEHLDAYIAVSGVQALFEELRTCGARVIRELQE